MTTIATRSIPIDFNRKLIFSSSSNSDDHDEVALRDFPHPSSFPFDTTSHESYCSKCFCYVCEIVAPCLQWTGASGHCNVT